MSVNPFWTDYYIVYRRKKYPMCVDFSPEIIRRGDNGDNW